MNKSLDENQKLNLEIIKNIPLDNLSLEISPQEETSMMKLSTINSISNNQCINYNNPNIRPYKTLSNDQQNQELLNILEEHDKKINLYKKMAKNYCESEKNFIDSTNKLRECKKILNDKEQKLFYIREKYNNLKTDYQNLCAEFQDMKSDNEKLYVCIEELKNDLNVQKENNNALLSKIQCYEEKNSYSINQYNEYKFMLDKKDEEINKLLLKNEEFSKKLAELQKINQEYNGKLKNLELQNYENLQKIEEYSKNSQDFEINCKVNEQKALDNMLCNINEILDKNIKKFFELLEFGENFIESPINNNITQEQLGFFQIDQNILNSSSVTSFSKLIILFERTKNIIENFSLKYQKLYNEYINEKNNLNNKIDSLSNILNETNKELMAYKKNNSLLKSTSRKKESESSKNISRLKINTDKIQIELEMLKSFIKETYEKIIIKYQKINPDFNPSKSSKILEKEMLIEQENIFNNLIENFLSLNEEINENKKILECNRKLANENSELYKNINELKNEINNININNQNLIEGFKVKYEISLNEKIYETEKEFSEKLKKMNIQIQEKEEEIDKISKNYNLLYKQYKMILSNKKKKDE